MSDLDFRAVNHGTIYLLTPLTERARKHLTPERVQSDAQWLGESLVVEHRYIMSLAIDLSIAGFTVRVE